MQPTTLTAPAASADIIDTTTADFTTDVIAESQVRPVLVDFWAPWCGPCKQLTPILEKIIAENKGRVRLVKLNIDDHPEIPGQMGVQSIPAIVAFVDGQPRDGFMGVQPEPQIQEFIDRLVGPMPAAAIDDLLAAGQQALDDKSYGEATTAFTAALQEEHDNLTALAGLIKAMTGAGELESAREIIDALEREHRTDPLLKAAETALEFAEQAAELGDDADLLARVQADPADHQARLDLATILNGRGDRAGAVEQLIQSMTIDMEWQETAARKQLLAFFDVWGNADSDTVRGRRRLSSLLFR